MPDWERYRLDPRYYLPTGRAAVTERAPPTCPNGHPLGPDRVLVGNHPCVKCTGSSHRTWRCRECDACWIWPACIDKPDWPEWARPKANLDDT